MSLKIRTGLLVVLAATIWGCSLSSRSDAPPRVQDTKPPALGTDDKKLAAKSGPELAEPGTVDKKVKAKNAPKLAEKQKIDIEVAEVARSYRKYRRMTEESFMVNSALASLCVGATVEQVERERLRHGPHTLASIDIYMNDLASAAFDSESKTYPEGSVVVKHKRLGYYQGMSEERYKVDNGVGGMIKRHKGFDPRGGDWEFFYFEDIKAIQTERVGSCLTCHASAADRDYVFGYWQSEDAANRLREGWPAPR